MSDGAWIVLLAAGRGERLGKGPKALVPLGGEPILRYSMEAAGASREIESVVIVAELEEVDDLLHQVSRQAREKIFRVVPGGEARRDSVLQGLRAVKLQTLHSEVDPIVLVHDAARPFASPDLLDEIVVAAREGAVICAEPVVDTVKRVEGEKIVATLSREELALAQTPQAARMSLLIRAHEESLDRPAGDDSVLLESLGEPVRVVRGPSTNFKITTPDDLRLAEAWVQAGGASWMPSTQVRN